MIDSLRMYYQLTKPGIIYGNVLNATAGFLLASSLVGYLDVWLGVATLVSIALIVGASCVWNNYIDREIDKKMVRTKQRALANGAVSTGKALAYGTLLGAVGFTLLATYTNAITVGLGVLAVVMYVAVYGIVKRRSVFGTLVGSIPGALPPVAGYAAVTQQLDLGAGIVFLIFALWQLPHFYAIALYRQHEYTAAGIPLWPIKKGVRSTKLQIVLFVTAFAVANVFLTAFGYTGYVYLVVMSLVSLVWFWRSLQGFDTHGRDESIRWAKKMFLFSLIVVLILTVVMALGALLP